MKLAIVTDSTCDLSQARLAELAVHNVPLYINFKSKAHKDWLEITPAEIIAGVDLGEDLPKTSQPTPADFETIFKTAVDKGAEEILCLTISRELSGTAQSAQIASQQASVPVTVYDSRSASLGLGAMVEKAATMRKAGASLSDIIKALDNIRDNGRIYFTVGGLEFLQKGGRIGKASALVGSLLKVKPLLEVCEGSIGPLGKARGNKKALKELVKQVTTYTNQHQGKTIAYFIYIQTSENVNLLKTALDEAGIIYEDRGSFEMGAVITSHVGPGTYGVCLHTG